MSVCDNRDGGGGGQAQVLLLTQASTEVTRYNQLSQKQCWTYRDKDKHQVQNCFFEQCYIEFLPCQRAFAEIDGDFGVLQVEIDLGREI